MCQQLHIVEINLAAKKQVVLDLKTQLQQAKEKAWVAKEVAEAAVVAFYERGVKDIKTRLTEEVAVVCRDYYIESWGVAMDRAGVPIDSKLRRIENIFFLEDICEIPNSDPPTENPLPSQAIVPDPSVPAREGVDKEV